MTYPQDLQPYYVLAGVWATYYALHSLTASGKAHALFPDRQKFRLAYSIVATLTLAGPLWAMARIPREWIAGEPNDVNKYAGMMLIVGGVIVLRKAMRAYSASVFLGLRKPPEDESGLKTDGPLAHVRHPLYAGALLVIWGYFVFYPHWSALVTASLTTAYVFVGIRLEERRLLRAFGDEYREYMRRVPALLPFGGRKKG